MVRSKNSSWLVFGAGLILGGAGCTHAPAPESEPQRQVVETPEAREPGEPDDTQDITAPPEEVLDEPLDDYARSRPPEPPPIEVVERDPSRRAAKSLIKLGKPPKKTRKGCIEQEELHAFMQEQKVYQAELGRLQIEAAGWTQLPAQPLDPHRPRPTAVTLARIEQEDGTALLYAGRSEPGGVLRGEHVLDAQQRVFPVQLFYACASTVTLKMCGVALQEGRGIPWRPDEYWDWYVTAPQTARMIRPAEPQRIDVKVPRCYTFEAESYSGPPP